MPYPCHLMSNRYFRYLSVLALIAVAGLGVSQFIWFSKAYHLKEIAFSQNVHMALRDVAISLLRFNQNNAPVGNPVFQEANNYFVVRVDDEINADLLEELLIKEFDRRKIELDFEYGIYDCSSNRIRYGNYISFEKKFSQATKSEFPNIYHENNYFGVRFPQKSGALIAEMHTVLVSTFLALLVIVFFVLALYIIFKQKQLSEIQKDFVNNMTHEFKTPIASIAIAAEVLKTLDPQKAALKLQKYAEIIQNEAMRLQTQVEQILQSSRDASKHLAANKTEIDLDAFVKDHAKQAVWNNISLEMVLINGPFKINFDAFHLNNMLHNLLENAIKYANHPLHIHIKIEKIGRHVFLAFSDNGPGIPKPYRKRVFDKFFRVPTGLTHNNKGFGLGLYYVKQVMLAHKGSVTCAETNDKGCCILLKFLI